MVHSIVFGMDDKANGGDATEANIEPQPAQVVTVGESDFGFGGAEPASTAGDSAQGSSVQVDAATAPVAGADDSQANNEGEGEDGFGFEDASEHGN